MSFQSFFKKSGVIVLSVFLIAFAIMTSVFIQPLTSDAQPHNKGVSGTSEREINTTNNEKHVITLITGDIVTVTEVEDGEDLVTVDPSSSSNEGIRMMTVGEDTYVFPQKAMPYLAAGVLDEELFNITALIDYGYDDSNRSTLPLIVQYSNNTRAKTLDSPSELEGVKEMHILESIQSAALSEDKKKAENFWDNITEDSK